MKVRPTGGMLTEREDLSSRRRKPVPVPRLRIFGIYKDKLTDNCRR